MWLKTYKFLKYLQHEQNNNDTIPSIDANTGAPGSERLGVFMSNESLGEYVSLPKIFVLHRKKLIVLQEGNNGLWYVGLTCNGNLAMESFERIWNVIVLGIVVGLAIGALSFIYIKFIS